MPNYKTSRRGQRTKDKGQKTKDKRQRTKNKRSKQHGGKYAKSATETYALTILVKQIVVLIVLNANIVIEFNGNVLWINPYGSLSIQPIDEYNIPSNVGKIAFEFGDMCDPTGCHMNDGGDTEYKGCVAVWYEDNRTPITDYYPEPDPTKTDKQLTGEQLNFKDVTLPKYTKIMNELLTYVSKKEVVRRLTYVAPVEQVAPVAPVEQV
jgi:hypothetical protein